MSGQHMLLKHFRVGSLIFQKREGQTLAPRLRLGHHGQPHGKQGEQQSTLRLLEPRPALATQRRLSARFEAGHDVIQAAGQAILLISVTDQPVADVKIEVIAAKTVRQISIGTAP